MTTDKIRELLETYRNAAIGTGTLDHVRSNDCAKCLLECYRALRNEELGRAGIVSLLSHDNPFVRAWAGAHSLQWEPVNARAVLEALRESNGPGSFDAKWTLVAFDSGSLSFD